MNKPIILHIPHSSTFIPEEFYEDFTVGLDDELKNMTDYFTADLFDLPFSKLVFPVSRLLCDVERFIYDEKEEMSKIGMGVCYTRGYNGKELRKINNIKKKKIIDNYYLPHHNKLNYLTKKSLTIFGRCLIIDCHSFSQYPLPYEPDKNPNRPDICIGTDDFHTPDYIKQYMLNSFIEKGYIVELNTPYSGTIVPSKYYMTDPRVNSIMIEINRGLYIDENCCRKKRYNKIKNDIADIINSVSKYY